MSVSVNPPKSPVTAGSKGIAAATVPNVCKMPGPPAPFVPAPLPNIGTSDSSPKKYSKKVTFDGKKVAIKGATFKSKGDVASKGTGGGLISANTHGPTSFVGPGSMDVKAEGKNVQLLSDPMLNNCGGSGNPPNAATLAGVLQPPGLVAVFGDEDCPLCQSTHEEEGQLAESGATSGACAAVKAAATAAVVAARAEQAARQAAADAREAARAEAAKAGLRAHMAKAPPAAHPAIQAVIDRIQPKQVTVNVGTRIFGMIGAVEGNQGRIFAGFSSAQWLDVERRLDGYHSPTAYRSLVEDMPADPGLPPVGRFLAHVGNQAAFTEAWERAAVNADAYDQASGASAAYEPGQCAAQLMVLLALDHGCLPKALTEQWYDSHDAGATYKAALNVREMPAGAAAPGPARQSTATEFGPDDAVPPCETCEVILNALMCTDDRPDDCVHRAVAPNVCTCT